MKRLFAIYSFSRKGFNSHRVALLAVAHKWLASMMLNA